VIYNVILSSDRPIKHESMVAEFDNNDSPASCLLPAVAASEATKPVSDTILSRDEQDYLEAHLDHEVAPTFNGACDDLSGFGRSQGITLPTTIVGDVNMPA
jgi:hypothetical protein